MATTAGEMKTAEDSPIPALIFIIMADSVQGAGAGSLLKTVLEGRVAWVRIRVSANTGALTIRGPASLLPDNGRGCKVFPAARGIRAGAEILHETIHFLA
jgi:hypothetical protein